MEFAYQSLGPTLRTVVLVFLLVALVVVVLFAISLAALPGYIAKRNRHPQSSAINVCGWLGLPTGVFWLVAIVWANVKQPNAQPLARVYDDEISELEALVSRLEKRIGQNDSRAT